MTALSSDCVGHSRSANNLKMNLSNLFQRTSEYKIWIIDNRIQYLIYFLLCCYFNGYCINYFPKSMHKVEFSINVTVCCTRLHHLLERK